MTQITHIKNSIQFSSVPSASSADEFSGIRSPTVNPSYKLGTSIVAATVLASLAVCLATVGRRPAVARGGQDLGAGRSPRCVSPRRASGRPVTEADFADRVCVASFVFTHCPLSCPRISAVMKGLQGRFEGTGVRLVSVTVDPDATHPRSSPITPAGSRPTPTAGGS